MSDLAPHIKSLLFDHDCVIIPNFGGFVANPHPAKINKLKGRIEPPYKEVGFNPQLKKNDGLLANQIRQLENISYESALDGIQLEVDKINSLLNQGKSYRLEEIGQFYLDNQKKIRFSPFNKLQFNLDFFGFEAVRALQLEVDNTDDATPEIKEPIQKVSHSEQKETPVIPLNQESKNRNWKSYAMVAACVPLLLYLLWVPTRLNINDSQVRFQMSDLNPYSTPPCPLYEVRTATPVEVEFQEMKEDQNLFKELALSNENYVEASFFETNSPEYNAKELITIELRNFPAAAISTRVIHAFVPADRLNTYYVVGGCFEEYSNANNFINQLRRQGLNAVLVDKKGRLYRVGIEGTNNKTEVLNSLDRIRTMGYSDAWVLKK